MAATLRSLDLVLRLKRRRIDKLRVQLATQAEQLKASQAEHARALEHWHECRRTEAECGDKIEQMSTRPQGFLPSDLIALKHVLETLGALTQRAQADAVAAERRVHAARDAMQATRRQIEKAEMQYDKLTQRRELLARELDNAQEDTQDEESEEASVARLVAAAREAQSLEFTEA